MLFCTFCLQEWNNLFPRVSHLNTLWSEWGETLVGSDHEYVREESSVNQAIWIQKYLAATSIIRESSNNIYFDVYLKVKEVCHKAIYHGSDVVAVMFHLWMSIKTNMKFVIKVHLTPKTFFAKIIKLILGSKLGQKIFDLVKSLSFYARSKPSFEQFTTAHGESGER